MDIFAHLLRHMDDLSNPLTHLHSKNFSRFSKRQADIPPNIQSRFNLVFNKLRILRYCRSKLASQNLNVVLRLTTDCTVLDLRMEQTLSRKATTEN